MVWVDFIKEVASIITAIGIVTPILHKFIIKPVLKSFEKRRNAEREFLADRNAREHEEMMEGFQMSMRPHLEKVERNKERIGAVETTIYDHNDRIIDIEREVFPEYKGDD